MKNSTDAKIASDDHQVSASTDENDFVLLACGVSDSWSVFVDESLNGPRLTYMQIDGPTIYVSFSIASEQIVDKIVRFLAPRQAKTANGAAVLPPKSGETISIGKNNRFPVRLICDSEDIERYVLMIGTAKSSLVRYTIYGDDLAHLIDAMGQVRDELVRDGLL